MSGNNFDKNKEEKEFNNLKNKIISNSYIQSLINKYKLTNEQINNNLDVFYNILIDVENQENKNFINDIYIYDEKHLIQIKKPTKNFLIKEQKNKNHVLSQITNLNENVIMINEKVWKENSFTFTKNNLGKPRKKLFTWLKTFYVQLKENKIEKGLFLFGPSGSGKTLFLSALANHLLQKNKKIIYLNVNDLKLYLVNKIKKNNNEEIDEIVNIIKNIDFLLLDDLGNERSINWLILEIIYTIIDFRFNNNLPVFITSNYNLKSLCTKYINQNKNEQVMIEKLINRLKSMCIEIESIEQ